MSYQSSCGFLILDRKGEYIKDTIDQRGNNVPGLHHHPNAASRMVVVSQRDYSGLKERGEIFDYLQPCFNIQDIDPCDLGDFLPGWTPPQLDIIHDYGQLERFYQKILSETSFGFVDKHNWFRDFPGLCELKETGKKLLKGFEANAIQDQRDTLLDEEQDLLQEYLTGTKAAILERVATRIKRFCNNPFFGGSASGLKILNHNSCVDTVLAYLSQGKCVFIDMQGQRDENYTIVAALFARCLLNINKAQQDDAHHIRACLVMEEAHNILSEEEVKKGNGRGSVFIELAREGRSSKLGFILVTQQPDVRSIDLQIVKTLNTVVAFHMPLEDAKHIQRLKTSFAGLELKISNAPEFHGIAIADTVAIPFQSMPVDTTYMQDCNDGSVSTMIECQIYDWPQVSRNALNGHNDQDEQISEIVTSEPVSIEERLALLLQQRRESIHEIALRAHKAWGENYSFNQEEDIENE